MEGKNIVILGRLTEGNLHRLPELAAELVYAGVGVIVTFGGTPPTLAAKQATHTIPILSPSAGDPVEPGLVASPSRFRSPRSSGPTR